jgi:hypothetical protein
MLSRWELYYMKRFLARHLCRAILEDLFKNISSKLMHIPTCSNNGIQFNQIKLAKQKFNEIVGVSQQAIALSHMRAS